MAKKKQSPNWIDVSQEFKEAHAASGISLSAFCTQKLLAPSEAKKHINVKDIKASIKADKVPQGVDSAPKSSKKTKKAERGEQAPASDKHICGAKLGGKARKGICTRKAGFGVKGVKTGRCYQHLGTEVAPADYKAPVAKKNGAPQGNKNAHKHGAYASVIDPEALEAVSGISTMDLQDATTLLNAQMWMLSKYQMDKLKLHRGLLTAAVAKGDSEAINDAERGIETALAGPAITMEKLLRAQGTLAKAQLDMIRFTREQHPLTKTEQLALLQNIILKAEDGTPMEDICMAAALKGIEVPPTMMAILKEDLKVRIEETPEVPEELSADDLEEIYDGVMEYAAEMHQTVEGRSQMLQAKSDEMKGALNGVVDGGA